METYEKWLETLETLHLPRYEDLSDIPLYLDQILEYVNVVLGDLFMFEEVILTQSMINNYVKLKVMPAPIKKRYGKRHLAYIMVITLLKQMMSLNHISVGIEEMLVNYDIETSYNLFINYVEESMRFTLAEIYGDKHQYQEKEEGLMAIPLKAATLAFAGKIIADYSFKNLLTKEKL